MTEVQGAEKSAASPASNKLGGNEKHAQLYSRMIHILNDNPFFLKTLSHLVDQADFDNLSNAIVNIATPAGRVLPVIHDIIATEFEHNFRNPGSIMRGNCVASKVMGAYSRLNGREFLKKCVGDLVEEIVEKGESFSVCAEDNRIAAAPDCTCMASHLL